MKRQNSFEYKCMKVKQGIFEEKDKQNLSFIIIILVLLSGFESKTREAKSNHINTQTTQITPIVGHSIIESRIKNSSKHKYTCTLPPVC